MAVDTAIIGLLRKLPDKGEQWTLSEQTRFLIAFADIIKFIYPVKTG